eukprot:GHRQ01031321.1.p1 GENE.GHRQ01031321.1~~GHRQ01031321.1.p1  ORF type:complete len:160 (-),score=7.73 GHRQ01031321.1:44-523(-)
MSICTLQCSLGLAAVGGICCLHPVLASCQCCVRICMCSCSCSFPVHALFLVKPHIVISLLPAAPIYVDIEYTRGREIVSRKGPGQAVRIGRMPLMLRCNRWALAGHGLWIRASALVHAAQECCQEVLLAGPYAAGMSLCIVAPMCGGLVSSWCCRSVVI